ncbi:MAG: nucleoside triphosphate pyrophosphatase [Anaerolineae bacterium]
MITERLILASASPRRRKLFSLLEVPFVTAAAYVDEESEEGESPQDMVCRLSLAKAKAVALSYPEGLIVAADTIVVLNGETLGKPADEAEAVAMLRRLRGRKHNVLSGVTVYHPAPPLSPPQGWGGWGGRAITELAESAVWMRAYADEEMAHYAASGDPLDKAGAYAIQHRNFSPVERIEGCYTSVMGLPLCHLARALAQLGMMLPVDVPQACQAFTGHRCLVAEEILQDSAGRRFP